MWFQVVPDAVRQVLRSNFGIFSIHGGHDGPDQPTVRPETGADLCRRRAQRVLRVESGRVSTLSCIHPPQSETTVTSPFPLSRSSLSSRLAPDYVKGWGRGSSGDVTVSKLKFSTDVKTLSGKANRFSGWTT